MTNDLVKEHYKETCRCVLLEGQSSLEVIWYRVIEGEEQNQKILSTLLKNSRDSLEIDVLSKACTAVQDQFTPNLSTTRTESHRGCVDTKGIICKTNIASEEMPKYSSHPTMTNNR
jgi:hypothetical protein